MVSDKGPEPGGECNPAPLPERDVDTALSSGQWIVFSDMDGTLLNHQSYDVRSALPMIEWLAEQSIPLIFNTSKTRAEMQDWQTILGHQQAFIIENGSAICFPEPPGKQTATPHPTLILGTPFAELEDFYLTHAAGTTSLCHCSLQQAMKLTDLPADQARLARQRDYSIPLQFNDPRQLADFTQHATEAGYQCVAGGRFVHLMGRTDKAKAMQTFTQWYAQHNGTTAKSLALGDSMNDLEMLEAANYSIIVRSPSSSRLARSHSPHYHSKKPAPAGWREGLHHFFHYRPPIPEEASHG